MSSIKILDGALGTEIISRGINLPNYIWSAHTNTENPSLVYKIHKKYIDSGANYITTNTFRTTIRSYLKTGLTADDAKEEAYKSFSNAIDMASKAVEGSDVKILGSIAPLEDCYMPSNYPGDKMAQSEFLELYDWFSDSKVDVFILETMNNLPEIITCLKVFSSTEKPIWLSLNILDHKHILSGEKIKDVVDEISKFNVSALLLNCNSIEKTSLALKGISQFWDKDWGVYPNLGLGDPAPDGVISDYSDMESFMDISEKAVDFGANIIGACCGSNYKHIVALSNQFK